MFVTQAMSSQSRSRIFYSPQVIRAKAGVDPQAAVAMMEATASADLDSRIPMNALTNEARRVGHLPGRTRRISLEVRLEPFGHLSRRTSVPLKRSR